MWGIGGYCGGGGGGEEQGGCEVGLLQRCVMKKKRLQNDKQKKTSTGVINLWVVCEYAFDERMVLKGSEDGYLLLPQPSQRGGF